MAYHLSCRNIKLDDKQILHADAQNKYGHWAPTFIPLNTVLGNINGNFEWGKQAFGNSARSIRLEDAGEKLSAELHDGRTWVPTSVMLSDKITNDDGVLRALVPVVVNYPEEQVQPIIEKISEQLRSDPNMAVTVVPTAEGGQKAFIIHPQHEEIKGPEHIGACPIIKTSDTKIADEFSKLLDRHETHLYEKKWVLPNPAGKELEAFSTGFTNELDTHATSSGFTQTGFQSFEPAISINTNAGFKFPSGPEKANIDIGHLF